MPTACKHLINKKSYIHHQKISPCVNAFSLKYEVCGKFKTQKMHIARVADGLAQGNCSFLSASYRLTAAKSTNYIVTFLNIVNVAHTLERFPLSSFNVLEQLTLAWKTGI